MSDSAGRTVAIVGEGADRSKFGNKAQLAHLTAGFIVYPVHPTLAEVEGVHCYATVAAVPTDHLDRVTFYVPPTIDMTLLDQLSVKSIEELLLNPGTASPALLT